MESIAINADSKEEKYRELLPQIRSLIQDESNGVANMANVAAALKQTFDHYSWVGFYLFEPASRQLVLGPFQGKIACTRIAVGTGVCGTAFARRSTIVVPDVNQFPGHIFCDGDSRSEIVVPLSVEGECVGVIDVDSYDYNSFDATDQRYLEQLMSFVSPAIGFHEKTKDHQSTKSL